MSKRVACGLWLLLLSKISDMIFPFETKDSFLCANSRPLEIAFDDDENGKWEENSGLKKSFSCDSCKALTMNNVDPPRDLLFNAKT